VAPSEDEIRRRLAEFAARWGGYQGSERSEAQTFLNQPVLELNREIVAGRIPYDPF
jgi:hypothetical protein